MKSANPDWHTVPRRALVPHPVTHPLPRFAPAWLAPLLLAGVAVPLPTAAQTIRVLSSNPRPSSLNGNTSITLNASPAGTAFSLVSGSQAVAGQPIAITVTLANPASTTVNVDGSFASASAALTAPASSIAIPTNCVFGLVPTGIPTTYTAFTQTTAFGVAGAGLELLAMSGLTANSTQTVTLSLKIDLSTLPNLPAGTYNGTLYLQAQAF